MSIVSSIIVFLLIWWTVLFTTLPIGVRQNTGDVHTGMRAAPDKPMMYKKIILTTVISIIVWIFVAILIQIDIISFRDMAKGM